MTQIYFYKLTTDNGGAPCVQQGLLSLAICKPMIRSKARVGDLIFGFAANSLHRDNRLLYAARVTKVLPDGEYYKKSGYARRNDCIYRFKKGRYVRRSGALYHQPKDLAHDLGAHPKYPRAIVLLSRDFRYFGKAGSDEYKSKYRLVKKAVEHKKQGHGVQHPPKLREQLLSLKNWVWGSTRNKEDGRPTSKPSRQACLRSRSCGVV